MIPNVTSYSLQNKLPVQLQKVSMHGPSLEMINKAFDYVLPYFKTRFPFDDKLTRNDIHLLSQKEADVCNHPFDTLSCALPSYRKGFNLTFEHKNHIVDVSITKEGDHYYSHSLHFNATKDVPLILMELLLVRIKNVVDSTQLCDVEIINSNRKTFDKELMIETLSIPSQSYMGNKINPKTTIEGFECYVKCNGKSYLAAIAEDPNEIRIRFEADEPTGLQIRMKRKAEEKKTLEEYEYSSINSAEEEENSQVRKDYILSKNKKSKLPEKTIDSDPEVDDRGNMNKPMSFNEYGKKIAELKKNPVVKSKIETIPKNLALSSAIIINAKQRIFDLLTFKYPFSNIQVADLWMIEGKWVPDIPYSEFYPTNDRRSVFCNKEFCEGYSILYQYKDEQYEIHINKQADKITCKEIKDLKQLPKSISNSLAQDAEQNAKLSFATMPAVQFSRENIVVLKIIDAEWRDGNPGVLSPLNHGFSITYTLKNRQGLEHIVTIDLDGNILPRK